MKMQLKKIYIFVMTIVVFCNSILSVSANSLPAYWEGTCLEGVTMADDNCPIEVVKEDLTFTITDFPEESYESVYEFNSYQSTMRAEYTFYNPTDNDITAKLFFPVGRIPESISKIADADKTWKAELERYDILVDGKSVDKTIRHLFWNEDVKFDVDSALEIANTEYIEDQFFSPRLKVTKYLYQVRNLEIDTEVFAVLSWTDANEKIKVRVPDMYGTHYENGKEFPKVSVTDNRTVEVFVIGNNDEEEFEWSFYEKDSKEVIKGKMALNNVEEMTFKELILDKYEEEYLVLENDWYNAIVQKMNDNTFSSGLLNNMKIDYSELYSTTMRWYEYDITIPAKKVLVNTVTAPLYPSYDEATCEDCYNYVYYLSPAKKWNKFGDLTIKIETPYKLETNNLEEFERIEEGYELKLDGLPDLEFEFAIKNVEESDEIKSFFLRAIGAVLVVGVVMRGIIMKKKENSNNDAMKGSA